MGFQVICQASVPQGKGTPAQLDVQIRTRALESLVKIVSLYYRVSHTKVRRVFPMFRVLYCPMRNSDERTI